MKGKISGHRVILLWAITFSLEMFFQPLAIKKDIFSLACHPKILFNAPKLRGWQMYLNDGLSKPLYVTKNYFAIHFYIASAFNKVLKPLPRDWIFKKRTAFVIVL